MKFLHRVMATLTGVQRDEVEVTWAKECWTHNIFRAWEILFGRRHGVRCEVSASWMDGLVTYEFHTFESIVAHFESRVREGLKFFPVRVYFPRLITPNGVTFPTGVYFAAAYDNSGIQTTNGTTTTITFTLTGSNLMLLSFPFVNSNVDAVTTVVWNTTETLTKQQTSHPSFSQYTYLWNLANPTSGSHNLVGTSVGASHRNIGVSYSGCNSTLDASTTSTVDNTATVTCSVTTTVPSCVIAAGTINNNGDANTSDGNVRQHNGAGFSAVDKSVTTAGSNSVTSSGGGFGATVDWGYTIASMSPFVPLQSSTSFFNLFDSQFFHN